MAPKKKGEKLALGDFLKDQNLGSWADEMDSQPLPSAPSGYAARRGDDRDGGERRAFTQPQWGEARTGGGGMGDRGASFDERPRYGDREQLPFPDKPPFTAHLGNLAYDVTRVDVEGFLSDCQVTSVRIVEDKLDQKPKGFGYVEFATADGLKKALEKTESHFMGRNIKISVAEPPKDRPEQTRDFSDWSRRGPLPDLPSQGRQPSRGFSRGAGGASFDDRSDAGSERGGSRRPGFFEGDNKVRDFSNWERKGPLSPAPGAGPPVRDGGRLREGGPPSGESRQSPAWGEGRSESGSRPPRREFEPARPSADRAPTAADQDSQWRTKMRADPSPAPTPDISTPTSPTAQAPKERPRLNLAKRTVSTADGEKDKDAASNTPSEAAKPATPAESKASPFGAARPIDTAQREREIEEKRQQAAKDKKDADDKAREEKQAKDAAERAARAERADNGLEKEEDKTASPFGGAKPRNERRPSNKQQQQQPPPPQQNGAKPAPKEKENGDAPAAKERPSFAILNREGQGEVGDDDAEEGEADAVDGPANGTIVGDKETKPQEVVQEVGKDTEEGAPQGSTTAETMEADGWSTVAGKAKSSRKGGARALAS